MDKTSPVTFSPVHRSYVRQVRSDKDLIKEYIAEELVQAVDVENTQRISTIFQDAPQEKVELYQNTVENESRLFSSKKGAISKAKYTIGFAELLSSGASQHQLEYWSDLFIWLEKNSLPNAQATSGFIELARLKASDDEARTFKRIALVYLDTVSDPTDKIRESNLREVTQNIISILQQEDISPEVKQDLLNEEIQKASGFAREEGKKMLKFLGKALLVGGSVMAKVAAALALLG